MQSSISGLLIIVCLASAVAGLYLLIRGLRGRRIGDEPRCARCGYILLHLQSLHCPECGSEISQGNTVIGRRVRRPWRAATGSLLLLLACLPLLSPVTNAVRNIPWYQYKPASWVVDDVDSPQLYRKAMSELQRRENAGGLSPSVRQTLIEKALQEQAGQQPPAFSSTRQELLEYLGTEVLAGRVTPEQKDRFLDEACKLTMTIRPIVAEGDKVPFWIWQNGRGPSGTHPDVFWLSHDDRERRIDGKVAGRHSGGGTSQLSGRGGSGMNEESGEIGKHKIESDVEFTVWHGPMSDEAMSQLIGRRKITVSGEYEVVARDKAPKIELLDSEELRQQVQAAVKLEDLSRQRAGYLNAQFQMAKPPCDLAFDVFIVTEKGETKIGSINGGKGAFSSYGTGTSQLKELPAKVKVILRGSEEVARQTINLSAIYAGEIVFEDVEVKQSNY